MMPALVHLFPNPTMVKVLSLFLLHPEGKFYQREIADRTGSLLRQVQRALRRVERAGLVTHSREGNRVYYQAARAHPAFDDLKRVFLKTVGLAEVVQQGLEGVRQQIRLAFIYGSLARGEEAARSDIDLLVVGQLKARGLVKVLGPVSLTLQRPFSFTVYPAREFREKASDGHHFVKAVLAAPKIWLIGSDDELGRLVA